MASTRKRTLPRLTHRTRHYEQPLLRPTWPFTHPSHYKADMVIYLIIRRQSMERRLLERLWRCMSQSCISLASCSPFQGSHLSLPLLPTCSRKGKRASSLSDYNKRLISLGKCHKEQRASNRIGPHWNWVSMGRKRRRNIRGLVMLTVTPSNSAMRQPVQTSVYS